MLEHAIAVANQGFHVFPLQPGHAGRERRDRPRTV